MSRRSVRYFLGRTWGSKAIDEGLFEYSWATAHQPGAVSRRGLFTLIVIAPFGGDHFHPKLSPHLGVHPAGFEELDLLFCALP